MRRSIRCAGVVVCPLLIAAFAIAPAEAQLSPENARAAFRHAPELRIELAASEPFVASPCAIAFDARGRLFVVENRGYPNSADPPLGRVVMLEDADGDGRMDQRSVVAEGLTFPNGVVPWNGGVLVTCAPEILFLKDTDGDGRADERRVVLTGFDTTGSTQLRVNSPMVGPDGWIWIASGLRGGTITSPEHPEYPALTLKSDLRFHPSTGRFEAVDGRSQYGHSFDEFGRRFICMNRVQVQHVVLPSRYLKRNPRLAFSDTVQNCPELVPNPLLQGGGGAARIYPISKNLTTADSHAGTFTAACAVHIWRGAGLPQQYRGCAFSCDPTGNLVHVDKLVPRGATFAAVPLLNEREFLASTDDWFRPVFLAEGPDGALYVCDMYRKVIEHPEYLPEEIRKRTDFESGREMGRIWRISKRDVAAAAENVLADYVGQLRKRDLAGTLSDKELADAFLNPDAGVREVALQLAERRIPQDGWWTDNALPLAEDRNPRVRFQFALSFGGIDQSRIAWALGTIAAQDRDDRWIRAAALTAASRRLPEFIEAIVAHDGSLPAGTLTLIAETAAFSDVTPVDALTNEFSHAFHGLEERTADKVMLALAVGTSEHQPARIPDDSELIRSLVQRAIRIVIAKSEAFETRSIALRFLARSTSATAQETVKRIAANEGDEELRLAASRALPDETLAAMTSDFSGNPRWVALPTKLRDLILTRMISRDGLVSRLVDALENGHLPPHLVDANRRQLLSKHKDPVIQERATKLFGVIAPNRQKSFEEAKGVLALQSNPSHGRTVFQRACASCHRLDREGYGVGPDLFGIRSQPKETILLQIVVPEHEIAPGFAAYFVETKDGRTLSGIIISETDESITLRQALAVDERILRRDIASLTANPLSFMPAGLEQTMTPQELADVLAYLKGEGP